MTQRDIVGLIASYVAAFGLLGAAEAIRAWRGYPQDFTRKLVHVGAGMWVFAILWLFDNWWAGIIPTATFIVLNYVFHRRSLFRAMDTAQSESLGTVWFALSVTLLLAIFWSQGRAYIAVAGIMAMTWGDALAALVGQRFGRHKYAVFGAERSGEGSAAMAGASFAAIALSLAILSPLGAMQVFAYSAVLALIAALAEAVSPSGTDNLSVPIVVSAALAMLA